MDPVVFQLARQLQTKLERINVQEDRDTFLWVHGFLVAVVDRIEAMTAKYAEAWPAWEDQADQIVATIESLVPLRSSASVRTVCSPNVWISESSEVVGWPIRAL